jgi:HSP20 family molecular chaperone IbpA
MTNRQFFRPLLTTTHLGYDQLFNELNNLMEKTIEPPSYPPYNILKDDTGYHVEVAVAGFKKSDIQIEHQRSQGQLLISSVSPTAETERSGLEVIRKGIARRAFSLSFKVADDLEVAGATLEDGYLVVSLRSIKKEEDKPLLITIS